jgi:hypothetical protein
MSRSLLLLCLIALSGCGKYSIRNIDNPPPRPAYGGWLKPDGTVLPEIEAKRALLECGAPSPELSILAYELALGIKDSDDTIKHMLMVRGCMEQAGLRRQPGWDSLRSSCKVQAHFSAFPACQPGAVFPERSVERRLNSWYCKVKTDREYCRKHAFNPAACDDPKKDYNNPPPECRP